MKVLLINPPLINMIMHNFPEPLERLNACYPPLGLLYVASYALKYGECEIGFLDGQVEKLDYDDLKRRIRDYRPDLVGIYASSFIMVDALNTARITKEINKDIHVCLGGPHPTLFPAQTLRLKDVDFIIAGEGEMVFTELINHIRGSKEFTSIKGLGFKNKDGITLNKPRGYMDNLDMLPFPARRISPCNKYYCYMGREAVATTMISSRGCPYKCAFCSRLGGDKFRTRSTANILAEIEDCLELNIKDFLFFDDTFTTSRVRVMELCEGIIMKGIKINWAIRTRVDNVDKEMLEKLREAGCFRIHYGVESGTDEILKRLKKEIDLRTIEETFKMTKEAGISTFADFMIGSPGETDYHINKTIEFAKKLEPDFLEFTVTTPYPATELYERGVEEGIVNPERWRRFAENPSQDFTPQFWEENFSHEELTEWLNIAYKKFYTRPAYVLKKLSEIRSPQEFFRKANVGLKILGF